MTEYNDNNKIIENNEDYEVHEFKHSFVDTPWDDRSRNSKIGLIALLVSIFFVTMALIINNFVMHYRVNVDHESVSCQLVKMDDYKFIPRVLLAGKNNPICLGAVISKESVIVNEECTKHGTIRLKLGNAYDPRCKKTLSVNAVEFITYARTDLMKFAVLTNHEKSLLECGERIKIGKNLDINSKAYVIGKAANTGRFFSRQAVTLLHSDNSTDGQICVKDLGRCPVKRGDMLFQDGKLYGMAPKDVRAQDNMACFVDLRREDLGVEPSK